MEKALHKESEQKAYAAGTRRLRLVMMLLLPRAAQRTIRAEAVPLLMSSVLSSWIVVIIIVIIVTVMVTSFSIILIIMTMVFLHLLRARYLKRILGSTNVGGSFLSRGLKPQEQDPTSTESDRHVREHSASPVPRIPSVTAVGWPLSFRCRHPRW